MGTRWRQTCDEEKQKEEECSAVRRTRPWPRFTAPDRRAFISTSLRHSPRRLTISDALFRFVFPATVRRNITNWVEGGGRGGVLVHYCFETRSEGFNEGWSVSSELLLLPFHVFDHCHGVGRPFCQATSRPNLHITGLLESIWPFYSRVHP